MEYHLTPNLFLLSVVHYVRTLTEGFSLCLVQPALTPTDRWVRAAQASKQQPRNLQPPSASRHAPRSAPFYNQPRPTSPRRMATSAESLGSAQFQPFSAPRSGDGRRGNRRGPPGVAPKPSRWHQEPPVDYW